MDMTVCTRYSVHCRHFGIGRGRAKPGICYPEGHLAIPAIGMHVVESLDEYDTTHSDVQSSP